MQSVALDVLERRLLTEMEGDILQKFECMAKVLITCPDKDLTAGRKALIVLATEQYLNMKCGFKTENLGVIHVRTHILYEEPKVGALRKLAKVVNG